MHIVYARLVQRVNERLISIAHLFEKCYYDFSRAYCSDRYVVVHDISNNQPNYYIFERPVFQVLSSFTKYTLNASNVRTAIRLDALQLVFRNKYHPRTSVKL